MAGNRVFLGLSHCDLCPRQQITWDHPEERRALQKGIRFSDSRLHALAGLIGLRVVEANPKDKACREGPRSRPTKAACQWRLPD